MAAPPPSGRPAAAPPPPPSSGGDSPSDSSLPASTPDRNALLGDIRAGMKLKKVSQQVTLPELTGNNTTSIENQLRNMISKRRQEIAEEPVEASEDDWSDNDN
jgi:hypothetical protein